MSDRLESMVYENIAKHLLLFDQYAKELSIMKRFCEPLESGEEAPLLKKLDDLKEKREHSRQELAELEYKIRTLVNEQPNHVKKISKVQERLDETRGKFDAYVSNISDLQQRLQTRHTCSTDLSDRAAEIKEHIKVLFDKLKHARDAYPGIYAQVEQELNIHFFNPLH